MFITSYKPVLQKNRLMALEPVRDYLCGDGDDTVRSTAAAAHVFVDCIRLHEEADEHMVVLCLNASGRVTGCFEMTAGSIMNVPFDVGGISLINFHSGSSFLVLFRGVMLQALNGQGVQRRGDAEESQATLCIPLTVRAESAAGETLTFLPPLEYASCTDPEKHWTLQPEGESAGRSSFFVKGELPEACALAEARENYDFVYVVAGWQLHDYGSRAMQHWEVVSKVSSRFYQYS